MLHSALPGESVWRWRMPRRLATASDFCLIPLAQGGLYPKLYITILWIMYILNPSKDLMWCMSVICNWNEFCMWWLLIQGLSQWYRESGSPFGNPVHFNLRRWAQVDSASLLPLSMALKVIEHARSIRRGLAIHLLPSTLDPSGGVYLFTSYQALQIRSVVSGLLTQLSVKVGDLLD